MTKKSSTFDSLKALKELPAPLWIINAADQSFMDVNDAAIELYGYSRDEFLTIPISQIDFFDEDEVVRKRTERVIKYGKEQFDTKHRTKSGDILDVVVSIRFYTEDVFPMLLVIVHDVTMTRGNEEQFKAIFENIQDGLLILDTESEKFVYGNHAILNMLDYSINEIKTIGVKDIVPPDLWDDKKSILKQMIAGELSFAPDAPVMRKDGSVFYADIDNSLPYNINNRKYLAAMIKDVSKRRETELKLANTQKIYESFFEQLHDAAWLVDPETLKIIDVNATAVDLYQYSKDELHDMYVMDIETVDTPEVMAKRKKQILENKTVSFETRHRRKDGSFMDVKVSLKLVELDERKLISAITEDVTEQKKQERLYMLNMRQAHMGEMVSMIAHQWRQPLAVVNSINSKLRMDMEFKSVDNAQLADYCNNIENQVVYLSNTINDFRNFFKPNREKELIGLNTVMEKVINIVGTTVKNANIRFTTDVEDMQIKTYVNEMVQVIIAMIKNSVDAFTEVSVDDKRIAIRTERTDKAVIMHIQDNAGGIKDEILDDIFLPYTTTKDEYNGTGLGLYMAKMIIEEHCKGSLNVMNVDGGAMFSLTLPQS